MHRCFFLNTTTSFFLEYRKNCMHENYSQDDLSKFLFYTMTFNNLTPVLSGKLEKRCKISYSQT
jgi:hypothetical protein